MRRGHRVVLMLVGLSATVVVALAAPGVAEASGILGSGVGPNVGPDLNPLPSVASMVKGIVDTIFGALLNALVPGFLRHAGEAALSWLVALPNPADASVWANVSALEGDMVWIAGAILPTLLLIGTARSTALSLALRAHPAEALLKAVGAVFWLLVYRWAVKNGIAAVNTLTHTILTQPTVDRGLKREVGVLFGGALVTGTGGALIALLGLVALFLALALFAMKVLTLVVLSILFVAGPLFIAVSPVPELAHVMRGWLYGLFAVCLIPIGWCLIFAVAGALTLDITSWANLTNPAHIPAVLTGAFAAIITFALALKWPLLILGHLRQAMTTFGPVRAGAGAPVSRGDLALKAQRARQKIQAAGLAAGRSAGVAAGQLGAPRRGAVGLGVRAAAAGAPGAAMLAAQAAKVKGNDGSPRERISRAKQTLLSDMPSQVKDAWQRAGASRGSEAAAGAVAAASHKPRSTRACATSTSGSSSRSSSRASRSRLVAAASEGSSAAPTAGRASRGTRQAGALPNAVSLTGRRLAAPAPERVAGAPTPTETAKAPELRRQATAPARPHPMTERRAQTTPVKPAATTRTPVPPAKPQAEPSRARPSAEAVAPAEPVREPGLAPPAPRVPPRSQR